MIRQMLREPLGTWTSGSWHSRRNDLIFRCQPPKILMPVTRLPMGWRSQNRLPGGVSAAKENWCICQDGLDTSALLLLAANGCCALLTVRCSEGDQMAWCCRSRGSHTMALVGCNAIRGGKFFEHQVSSPKIIFDGRKICLHFGHPPRPVYLAVRRFPWRNMSRCLPLASPLTGLASTCE